jgi:hypothetical protein
VLVLALGLWLVASLPAALGWTTFYYRDLAEVFIPFKAFGPAELHAGRVPATNPTWGLGQPFRGDPNADAFYPGNLLCLVLLGVVVAPGRHRVLLWVSGWPEAVAAGLGACAFVVLLTLARRRAGR